MNTIVNNFLFEMVREDSKHYVIKIQHKSKFGEVKYEYINKTMFTTLQEFAEYY